MSVEGIGWSVPGGSLGDWLVDGFHPPEIRPRRLGEALGKMWRIPADSSR
jgi:hypothetical protein